MDLIAKAQEFLKKVAENDPEPVRLEREGDGPYIKLDLGLGVYEVEDPSGLGFNETPGLIIPELLNPGSDSSDEEALNPGITEVSEDGAPVKKMKRSDSPQNF